MKSAIILWFRKDLRLRDNPALTAAAASGRPVLPIFILDERTTRTLGGAAKWWLHGSLRDLRARVPLVLRRGDPVKVLAEVIAETGADGLYWNRLYEPETQARDSHIKQNFRNGGIQVKSFPGRYLAEPHILMNKAGTTLKVFTPYWKALNTHFETHPLPDPLPVPSVTWVTGRSESLNDWDLTPKHPDWSGGLSATWTPGEEGAWQRFETFKASGIQTYIDDRNRPDLPKVSRLSPHLHWGEISVGQVWHDTKRHGQSCSHEHFLKELTWRDFAAYLLFHFSHLTNKNWRPEFDDFPWQTDPCVLRAWQRGQTGYPIVDAGMRELYTTGWMHNRVRMIVGSFLVKHLLHHWKAGESWFWDTLVDADPATNPASWQWIAGCGADAAPYFRIFNPIGQAQKFDPDGIYIKTWVPELSDLPREFVAKPWEASPLILRAAGVELGRTYPHPLVRHEDARARALAAFQGLKKDTV